MQNHQLKNKVALVSGSSMGIGKAIASDLAAQGVKVVLNGRDAERLAATEKEFLEKGYTVLAIKADIRFPDQCRQLIAQTIRNFGQLDILINNAAMSSRGSVERMAHINFKILMETNFNGAAHLSKYAIIYLKESRGHLIFINSAGGFRGMPFNSAYSASKIAQAALAEALRIELYDYGIHVGIAFVGFTKNDPGKTILDVDGSLIYLPLRTNVKLAPPEAVAKSIRRMILKRKPKITLSGLGLFADFTTRYMPQLAHYIILANRNKIQKQYTLIGGESAPSPSTIPGNKPE